MGASLVRRNHRTRSAVGPVVPTARGGRSIRILIETLAVMLVSVACAVVANLVPSIATVPGVMSLVLPLAYLLVEGRVRHRTLADLGIRRHGFVSGLKSCWWLFLLTVVLLQALGVAVARVFWPGTLSHISGRIPAFGDLPVLVPLILVLSLREELVFRGLFQERIGWFFGQVASVAGVSVLFAFTHIAPGAPAVVAGDLLFVFLDSLVYGAIYSRTRSVFVSWAAHAGSDLVGLALLMWAATGS